MIFLTKLQRDLFIDTKKKYQEKLLFQCVDYIPIEIKGDLWILPEDVLLDERFKELKLELLDSGKLGDIVTRELKNEELINFEI